MACNEQFFRTLEKLQIIKSKDVREVLFQANAGMWNLNPMKNQMDAAFIEGTNLAIQLWFKLHSGRKL